MTCMYRCLSQKEVGMQVGDFHGVFADQIMSLLATVMQSAVTSLKKKASGEDKPERIVLGILDSFPHHTDPEGAILYQSTCVSMLIPALEFAIEEIDWVSSPIANSILPAIFQDISNRVEKRLLVPSHALLNFILHCYQRSKLQYPKKVLDVHQNMQSAAQAIAKVLINMRYIFLFVHL